MASTSVLVELVCGELGIDASKPMVDRVKAAAQLVGIDFVSVRTTTEALAAQLLPVTREESSDDDVVLTHVETPRSKAKASLAEAVRTGAVVTIDENEPRRPPNWYERSKHLSARKLIVSLIESRLRTLARGGVCVVRNARNFPRAARLIEFRLLCDAASLSAYRDAKTLAARVRAELRILRDRAPAAAPAPAVTAAPTAPAPSPPATATAPAATAPTGPAVAPAPTVAPARIGGAPGSGTRSPRSPRTGDGRARTTSPPVFSATTRTAASSTTRARARTRSSTAAPVTSISRGARRIFSRGGEGC